ncbi:redoxin family protein [uncultured Paraglaciecola sp.]|uniref:TlpA family protein disulfide reductase n=1 Tax=uncultured Paraglaciecola sp. TaxID=1765024 RepID=UPI0025CEF60B|nr:redoxin family protein [uncultured Paraglaciecola sp.]
MNKIFNNLKQINWHIWLTDVIVLGAIVFALSLWQTRNMLDVDSSISVDKQLLMGLDGQISALIKPDKVTLIYFFAPWCQVCSLSIGNLTYLDPEKINIVRVALDYSHVGEVQDFANEQNLTSQIFLGNARLKQQFKIQGYPTYYIVDEHQKVLAKAYGYSTALGLKLRQIFSG